MRKIRFVTFLLVMVSISLAQFSAGQKSLDGGVAWASNSNDGEKTSTQLTVDPSLSYFIMNNISIDLTYIYYKYEPENEDSEEMTAFGAGATYYLGNLYFGGSWLDPNADGEEDTYAAAEVGYLYPLSQHVYLDLGGVYLMGLGDNKRETIGFGFGVRCFFP
ncbi:MAG: hypothetical protein H8D46_02170 [FCB group bacterium]|nr:hypothetical protein [FCB group bacterium]